MIYQVDGETLTLRKAAASLQNGDELRINPGVHPALELRGLSGVLVTGAPGAVLDGGAGTACMLTDCTGCTLRGLVARGAGRKYENAQGAGFRVTGGRDLVIEDCETTGFQRAGVELCGVQGARVERVCARDNGYCGILATWDGAGTVSRDITVRDCRALNNAGDPTITHNHSGNGILLDGVQGALVEFCEAAFNGWDMQNEEFNGPVGIWTAHADRAVIRYCVSHDNRTQWGKTDGGGFDFDGGTTNSLIEYCLSFSNDGAGYLLCQYENAPAMYGNEIRLSVSLDDGIGNHRCSLALCDCGSPARTEGGLVRGCVFYNSHGRDIVQGHLDETVLENCVLLKRGGGQYFRHEYLESALPHRGADRQTWGEVRFVQNQYHDFDLPDRRTKEPFLSIGSRAPLTDPRELPAYFTELELERLCGDAQPASQE